MSLYVICGYFVLSINPVCSHTCLATSAPSKNLGGLPRSVAYAMGSFPNAVATVRRWERCAANGTIGVFHHIWGPLEPHDLAGRGKNAFILKPLT